MELHEHVARVEAGPSGPRVGAFFDLDGTLVSGYTGTVFFTDRLRHRDIGLGEVLSTVVAGVDGTYFGGDPVRGATRALQAMAGQSEDTMYDLGERLFVQKIAGTIRAEARRLVRTHQRMGHTVAVASAATVYQIAPVARDLGISHRVCTQMEVEDGVLTGRVQGTLLWGSRKASGVRTFAREAGVDLDSSYGYGNGAEDVAFLDCVGRPAALNPQPGLRAAAARFGWPILELPDPGASGLVPLARTAAALGGLNIAAATGVAWGLLSGSRQRGINAGISLACDSALRLAGVRVVTTGMENLHRARPAIVVANHQSSIDPIVVGSLLRSDFTVVAKKEARFDPRSLMGGLLLDPAYIDRGNSAQARATLAALVSRIRGGTSLLVFPEGTRAPTPLPGAFRKGAFHLAVQSGVPVVPVVLRNTGEIMWRRSKVIGSGTVEVCVLEPVVDWRVEDLNRQVADLRQRFVDTLADWPGDR